MYDEKGNLIEFTDTERFEAIRRTKVEYILKTINPEQNPKMSPLKDITPLVNREKYVGTVRTKPKDYFNRYKNIDGVIITKNSILYKCLQEQNRTSELIEYDRFPEKEVK